MEGAGLGWSENGEGIWTCIKQVWASKWNERAYLSRRASAIQHEDLFMAVLIQRVVEAEYAFVIHTVNPFSGSRDELYAEVVLGLGETLVGNYPGRALSFSCPKGGKEAQRVELFAYPSKSVGLYGGGLIFRSDSNGEDLAGYAGAGLYDSIMIERPREVNLDYTSEPLVWAEDFRNGFLATIAKIGIVVEGVLGSPQDIEGAYAKGEYYVVQTRPQVGIDEA
jgi:alpha-glucan,water dikinase